MAFTPHQMRKAAEADFKRVTLDQMIDQYMHPVSYIEAGAYRSLSQTWACIKRKVQRTYMNVVAKQTAKTNIPGFSEAALRDEVAQVYLRVQRAQAALQPDLARDVSQRGWGGCGVAAAAKVRKLVLA
jgi:hypothetical protein